MAQKFMLLPKATKNAHCWQPHERQLCGHGHFEWPRRVKCPVQIDEPRIMGTYGQPELLTECNLDDGSLQFIASRLGDDAAVATTQPSE